MITTRHPYAAPLQAVLEAFPASMKRREHRARAAARAALEALNAGRNPLEALNASQDFLESLPHTPAAPVQFFPQKGQNLPQRPL